MSKNKNMNNTSSNNLDPYPKDRIYYGRVNEGDKQNSDRLLNVIYN